MTKSSGLEAGADLSDHRTFYFSGCHPRFLTLSSWNPFYYASISHSYLWILQMIHPRQGQTLAQPSNCRMLRKIPRLTTCGRINHIQSQQVNVPEWPRLQTSLYGTRAGFHVPSCITCRAAHQPYPSWSCALGKGEASENASVHLDFFQVHSVT